MTDQDASQPVDAKAQSRRHQQPAETEAARLAAAERKARQAAQLRANLQRRKHQARDRAADDHETGPED